MSENSPIRELRQGLGLSMREFAQALGCSYAALSACELGHYTGIPAPWRASIEALGEDYEDLNEAHRAWRRRQGANAAAGGRPERGASGLETQAGRGPSCVGVDLNEAHRA